VIIFESESTISQIYFDIAKIALFESESKELNHNALHQCPTSASK
jgi:hypothetical protein